jgi:CRP-like cAMP-binding protein
MNELAHDEQVLHEAIATLFDRQLHYMQEFLSFIRDTPRQRYLNLLKEKPQVAQRIPQRYIASYLGITPVHLSRIRNQLLKKNAT